MSTNDTFTAQQGVKILFGESSGIIAELDALIKNPNISNEDNHKIYIKVMAKLALMASMANQLNIIVQKSSQKLQPLQKSFITQQWLTMEKLSGECMEILKGKSIITEEMVGQLVSNLSFVNDRLEKQSPDLAKN
jgi:hypothetical protein